MFVCNCRPTHPYSANSNFFLAFPDFSFFSSAGFSSVLIFVCCGAVIDDSLVVSYRRFIVFFTIKLSLCKRLFRMRICSNNKADKSNRGAKNAIVFCIQYWL